MKARTAKAERIAAEEEAALRAIERRSVFARQEHLEAQEEAERNLRTRETRDEEEEVLMAEGGRRAQHLQEVQAHLRLQLRTEEDMAAPGGLDDEAQTDNRQHRGEGMRDSETCDAAAKEGSHGRRRRSGGFPD